MLKTAILTILSSLVFSFPVNAQTVSKISKIVYPGTPAANTVNTLFFYGFSPSTEYNFTRKGIYKNLAKLSDKCGMIRLDVPSQGWPYNIYYNNSSINPSNLSVFSPPPVCEKEGVLAPSPSSTIFKDSLNNVYFSGLIPEKAYFFLAPYILSKKVRSDSCGIIRIQQSEIESWPIASFVSFSIGSFSISMNKITTSITYPPLCRKVGNTSVIYRPAQ